MKVSRLAKWLLKKKIWRLALLNPSGWTSKLVAPGRQIYFSVLLTPLPENLTTTDLFARLQFFAGAKVEEKRIILPLKGGQEIGFRVAAGDLSSVGALALGQQILQMVQQSLETKPELKLCPK